MDTTIDTLAIEIETEAGNSLKNIDTLINRLEKLNSVLDGVMNHYNKLRKAMSSIKDIKIPKTDIPDEITQNVKIKPQVDITPIPKNITDTGSDTKLQTSEKKVEDTKVPKSKNIKQLGDDSKDSQKHIKKLINTLNDVGDALDKINNKTSGFLSPLKNTIKKIIPDSKTLSTSLRKSFSNALLGSARKFTLAMLGVRSMFTTLRSAVQEYLQYDTQLENSLRNNWAVLGSLLAPALEKIIHLFGIAVAYVRAFIKALTGIDLVAKANKKSLDAVGSSAKKALGNLAKFDELNVVEFPTKDGSGSSIPPLTTPEIDTSKIDWFVKYIKEGNWYGLGMEIGRLFNVGLRTIDFDWFTEVATQWAINIADLFNGLTDGIDWVLVGEKIAGGLNTAFAFVNTFFDTYNFDNLGTAVSTGLNSAFTNINVEALGTMLSNKINALFNFLGNFVDNFDWSAFGTNIGSAVNTWFSNIVWSKPATIISEAIIGIFNSIKSFLSEVDWDGIGTSIGTFFANIDWGGIWETIKETIFGAIGSFDEFLSAWVGEENATFIEALAIALGSVALAIGAISTAIGIYNGVLAISTAVNTAFNVSLGGLLLFLGLAVLAITAVVGIGLVLYKKWDDLKASAKDLAEKIKTAFTNIKNKVSEILTKVAEFFKNAWTNIKEAFKPENIKQFFSDTLSKIKDIFSNVGDWFGNIFSGAWEKIKKAFSKVDSFFSGIWTTIKNTFSTIGTTIGNAIGESFANVVNAILKFAEKTINGFIKSINKAIDVINAIPGVEISKLSTIEIPKLATGTNRIEAEGLYHLHKNEAVVPEKYNPAVNDNLYDNKGVIEAIDNVYDAINNLGITNVVNLGNKTLYKETIKYSKTQNDVYGENVMSV